MMIVFIGSQFLPQQKKTFCANSVTCIHDLSGRPDNSTVGFFEGQKVFAPPVLLADASTGKAVLGTASAPGTKHIYVDLSTQTLYAYQGKTLVLQTLISSGKWNQSPDGDFHIWIKLRSTRMAGGSGEDAYDLPNVPYVMYFYNQDVPKSEGFALHAAYWHDNFGHAMSHGCINLREVDAKALYDWVDPVTTGLTTYATQQDPGTEITITGHAPGV